MVGRTNYFALPTSTPIRLEFAPVYKWLGH
jgi:hypothetical protein